jgi:hypothetical protein
MHPWASVQVHYLPEVVVLQRYISTAERYFLERTRVRTDAVDVMAVVRRHE